MKKMCLVDVTQPAGSGDHSPDVADAPWKLGFAECPGKQNRMCISVVRQLQFGSYGESLFGMFDGGTHAEVPQFIADNIADVLRSEVSRHQIPAHTLPAFVHQIPAKYMKYAMLSMHRRLKSAGRRYGAAGVLLHLQRRSARQFVMTTANVGDVEVVLCRHGEAISLTRKFVTSADRSECQRVCKLDGFITADGRVNGATRCTRLLGCSYLHPHVIPDPHVNSVALGNDDALVVIGNATLWSHVTPVEAVAEIRDVTDPVSAAKRLRDLAQSCGAQTNIAVMVIRLDGNTGSTAAASATAAAAAQPKYATPSAQVRESRDETVPGDVTEATPSPAGVVSGLSTSTAGGRSSSSPQLSARGSDDFVRSAISIEGARHARQPRSPAPASTPATAATARQRFVKKAAGARDVELRQGGSPSSSLSSGSSGRPPSRADEPTETDRARDERPWGAAATPEPASGLSEPAPRSESALGSEPAPGSDISVAPLDFGRSVARRVAVFDRPPMSSDSSTGVSRVGGVPPASAGSQQRLPASSKDGRPTSGSGTSPVRRPKRRAAAVNAGKFRLNTSASGGGAPADSVTSPAAASAGQGEQSGTVVDDDEREFDDTRL